MSKEEVDNAMFRFTRPEKPGFKIGQPKFVNEELPPEQQGEAVCFDISGQWVDSPEKCSAKQVATKQGPKFFIKWCLDGPDKGHPLNPYSIYFRDGDEHRLEQRRGQRRYEFKIVNETAFNYYLSFLRTKLASHCQAAEREILNG